MSPLFLVPVVAIMAWAVITDETPQQSVEEQGLAAFRKSYECSLYNVLRQVDAHPASYEDRFVILSADNGEAFTQVWLYSSHQKVDFEVASLFDMHKPSEPRRYWPKRAQEVIAQYGFDLRVGETWNYTKVVKSDTLVDLHVIAREMLDILYLAFRPVEERPKISWGYIREHPLPANLVCLPEQ